MSDEPISHVFKVRGRPVGFRPSPYAGELVAVERGEFPVSPTGYRSLSGHFGGRGAIDPKEISEEFLEGLARDRDRERTFLLRDLGRPPRERGGPLDNFIGIYLTAHSAVNDGFFAPAADRVILWRGAYRLLCLIDANPRFQPAPSAPAWTMRLCATVLEQQRELLNFVRRLAAGDFTVEPPDSFFAARAYFDLPPKPGGETAFELPAISTEFAIEATTRSTSGNEDDKIKPDAVFAVPPNDTADDPNQLTLF